jgi:hypothetical protein
VVPVAIDRLSRIACRRNRLSRDVFAKRLRVELSVGPNHRRT